jgi:purine-binding chemotaxis protein CheW
VTGMQTILLPVGADLYAVPIEFVREVLGAPTVARLVTAPAYVIGLINLRGEIVPLLDTAALLGVGTVGPVSFAVVLRTAHGPAALAATGFPERAELGVACGPSELPGTAGMYQVDRRVAVLVDLDGLLGTDRLDGHEASAHASAGGVR